MMALKTKGERALYAKECKDRPIEGELNEIQALTPQQLKLLIIGVQKYAKPSKIKYEIVEKPYLLLPCNLSDLDEIKTFDDKILYIKSCLGQIDKNDPLVLNEIQSVDLPFIRDVVLDLNANERLLFNLIFKLKESTKREEQRLLQEFEMEDNPLFEEFEMEENPINY